MSAVASEFGRSWRLVAGSSLGIAIGVSSLYFYSLGIFVKPMAAEFGWGRGAASLGALVGTAGAALMAIPVGRLVDRVGSLKVAVGSLCVLALGFVALGALTSSLPTFLAVTAVVSLLSAGSTPLPYTRLIVGAFQQQRGMALGVTLAGTGVGALGIPTLLTPFVSNHGWRNGYFVLAAVIAGCLPLMAWLISSAPQDGVERIASPPSPEFVRNDTFRLLALIFFLVSIAILGGVVHFVPMLTDWGLSPAKAGAIAGLIGVTTIGGRLLVGALLDRVPPLAVTAGVFLIVAGGLATLDLGGSAYAILGALVLGLAIGAENHELHTDLPLITFYDHH